MSFETLLVGLRSSSPVQGVQPIPGSSSEGRFNKIRKALALPFQFLVHIYQSWKSPTSSVTKKMTSDVKLPWGARKTQNYVLTTLKKLHASDTIENGEKFTQSIDASISELVGFAKNHNVKETVQLLSSVLTQVKQKYSSDDYKHVNYGQSAGDVNYIHGFIPQLIESRVFEIVTEKARDEFLKTVCENPFSGDAVTIFNGVNEELQDIIQQNLPNDVEAFNLQPNNAQFPKNKSLEKEFRAIQTTSVKQFAAVYNLIDPTNETNPRHDMMDCLNRNLSFLNTSFNVDGTNNLFRNINSLVEKIDLKKMDEIYAKQARKANEVLAAQARNDKAKAKQKEKAEQKAAKKEAIQQQELVKIQKVNKEKVAKERLSIQTQCEKIFQQMREKNAQIQNLTERRQALSSLNNLDLELVPLEKTIQNLNSNIVECQERKNQRSKQIEDNCKIVTARGVSPAKQKEAIDIVAKLNLLITDDISSIQLNKDLENTQLLFQETKRKRDQQWNECHLIWPNTVEKELQKVEEQLIQSQAQLDAYQTNLKLKQDELVKCNAPLTQLDAEAAKPEKQPSSGINSSSVIIPVIQEKSEDAKNEIHSDAGASSSGVNNSTTNRDPLTRYNNVY